MPAMVRPNGPKYKKAKKIAYSILGTPANIAFSKSPFTKKVDRRLLFEETARIK